MHVASGNISYGEDAPCPHPTVEGKLHKWDARHGIKCPAQFCVDHHGNGTIFDRVNPTVFWEAAESLLYADIVQDSMFSGEWCGCGHFAATKAAGRKGIPRIFPHLFMFVVNLSSRALPTKNESNTRSLTATHTLSSTTRKRGPSSDAGLRTNFCHFLDDIPTRRLTSMHGNGKVDTPTTPAPNPLVL
jgi:hypothetical protein